MRQSGLYHQTLDIKKVENEIVNFHGDIVTTVWANHSWNVGFLNSILCVCDNVEGLEV